MKQCGCGRSIGLAIENVKQSRERISQEWVREDLELKELYRNFLKMDVYWRKYLEWQHRVYCLDGNLYSDPRPMLSKLDELDKS